MKIGWEDLQRDYLTLDMSVLKKVGQLLKEGKISEEKLEQLAMDNFAKFTTLTQIFQTYQTSSLEDEFECSENCQTEVLRLLIVLRQMILTTSDDGSVTQAAIRFGTFLANFADGCKSSKVFT